MDKPIYAPHEISFQRIYYLNFSRKNYIDYVRIGPLEEMLVHLDCKLYLRRVRKNREDQPLFLLHLW